MQYKLIAFDLDGTLLNDDKKLTAETLKTLEEAAGLGVNLVVATGRVFRALPEELKTLPYLRYYILVNGAYVYDRLEDKILFKAELPLKEALSIIRHMDTLPVIYDCYQNDQGYMSRSMYDGADDYLRRTPYMIELIRKVRIPVPDLHDYLKEKGEDVQKLQMFFMPEDEEMRQREFKRIEELFPDTKATSSVINNVEINCEKAGKGRALLQLAEILGIRREETAAFGDGTNDTEMLSAAGCGAAMANAQESVKAAADMITLSNNESGVAAGIRRLLGI